MLGAFLAGEDKVAPSPVNDSAVKVLIDGHALRVSHQAEEQKVALYAEAGPAGGGAPAHALVEKIGTRFNAELARGEHQSRFGAYDGSR